MLNVEMKIPTSFGIYRQGIRIKINENQFIYREIIYKVGENLESIKKYIENSLPGIKSIEFLKSEIGLCFLDIKNQHSIIETNNLIDKYWIDGETYLVDYKHDNEDKYLIMVIDSNLNKEEVIKLMSDDTINNVDQLSDCWIKRDLF